MQMTLLFRAIVLVLLTPLLLLFGGYSLFSEGSTAAYAWIFTGLCLGVFVAMFLPKIQAVKLLTATAFSVMIAIAGLIIYLSVQEILAGVATVSPKHGKPYLLYREEDGVRFWLNEILHIGVSLFPILFAAIFYMPANWFKPKNTLRWDTQIAMRGNVWTIEEVGRGKLARLVPLLFGACLFLAMLMLSYQFLQMAQKSWWLVLLISFFVGWFVLTRFLCLRCVTLNKTEQRVTVLKKFLGFWVWARDTDSLDRFYAVRTSLGSVHLVGLHGTTLLIKRFSELEDARQLRDALADWLGVKVLFDPSYPEIK
jgi:ABC-type transport system involved in multi-copper enzyme maturation permease subunit